MKKFLLSISLVAVFLAYSFHKKTEGNEQGIVTPPPSLNTQPNTNPPATLPVSTPPPTARYKDGTYTGDVTDAYYGNVQVQANISGGRITDVVFLDYPHDRENSVIINTQAMPYLKQEAIAAQSAQVDIVSGATQTSLAFRQSLQSAL